MKYKRAGKNRAVQNWKHYSTVQYRIGSITVRCSTEKQQYSTVQYIRAGNLNIIQQSISAVQCSARKDETEHSVILWTVQRQEVQPLVH